MTIVATVFKIISMKSSPCIESIIVSQNDPSKMVMTNDEEETHFQSPEGPKATIVVDVG